jgi:multiple sugar transport system substrate-binding protein
MRTKIVLKTASAMVGLALVAACSGGPAAETPASTAPTGDPNAPATLDFWTWTTNVDKVVDIWNKKNPTQQVKVNKQAQGEEIITRLLTASKAGNAPCLVHAEYQALPVLVTNGVVTDLTATVEPVKSQFPEGTLALTSFGGKSFGIPQDVGPMMLYYRKDLFDKYGLEVPTTWEQFAEVAKQVKEKDPKRSLTTFSAGDPGWFAGLAEQAGGNWWTSDGESWKVGVNDEATKKMATYWSGLVNDGTISGQPMYTPEWNAAMSDGSLLAWPSAVWGAGVLEGVAPSTKGKWAMAPMPQWNAGEQVTGFWGGSATAVSENCKDKPQAEKFATWLNTDPEALEALVTAGGIYPAATAGQTGPALEKAPKMLPDDAEFYTRASQIAQGARGFTWGPNVNVTYSSYTDEFQKAIQNKSDFAAALDQVQAKSVADLEKQGFPVAK